jgi:hypothetical protein
MKATELLHRQHQMLLQLLNALELERYYRLPLLRELRQQLAQHVADEAGEFAAAVRVVGPRALATMRKTHALAYEGIERLADAIDDPPRFIEEVRGLQRALARMIHREETELLARVEREIDDRVLEALGDSIARTPVPPPMSDRERTDEEVAHGRREDDPRERRARQRTWG